MLEYNEGLLDLYRKDYPKLSSYFLDIVRGGFLDEYRDIFRKTIGFKRKVFISKKVSILLHVILILPTYW